MDMHILTRKLSVSFVRFRAPLKHKRAVNYRAAEKGFLLLSSQEALMVVMKQPHTITNIIHLNTIIVRLFTIVTYTYNIINI
jgi:hypothetical protein